MLWKDSEQSDRGYFYLMDLNSTHGSVLNKDKVTPGTAVKITVGNNVIRFGGSTRSFMLNSVIAEKHEEVPGNDRVVEVKDTGCSWGMREDARAEEEEEEGEEEFMAKFTTLLNTPQNEPSPNENAFADNPQKTLQIWFDQEGYDFDYQVLPEGSHFKVIIQLPIEGRDVPIEGVCQSKKKDAITQLCLKVCKLLDRAERLYPWQHQNNRKRNRNKIEEEEEEDLYDETEQKTVKKAKKLLEQKLKEKQIGAETYESLKLKCEDWSKELCQVEERLQAMSKMKLQSARQEPDDVLDPLDRFMETQLVDDSKRMDVKIEKSKLKMKMKELEKQISRCEKLMVIARPTHIPLFNAQSSSRSDPQDKFVKRDAPEVSIVGTINKAVIQDLEPSVAKSSKFEMKLKPKIKSTSQIFAEDTEKIKSDVKKVQFSNEGLGVGASLKEMKQQALSASESHEDFIDWVPPKNQDGSGKTSLNDRYGY